MSFVSTGSINLYNFVPERKISTTYVRTSNKKLWNVKAILRIIELRTVLIISTVVLEKNTEILLTPGTNDSTGKTKLVLH